MAIIACMEMIRTRSKEDAYDVWASSSVVISTHDNIINIYNDNNKNGMKSQTCAKTCDRQFVATIALATSALAIMI
jgi:hypothetical protein